MTAQIDFIEPSSGSLQGELANAVGLNFNVHALRPFLNKYNQSMITKQVFNNKQGKFVFQSVPSMKHNASLSRDQWIEIDKIVVRVARERIGAVDDLLNRNLVYNIPNAMAKTILEYEKITDVGQAQISMDGISKTDNIAPTYSTAFLPLPIIHEDFFISRRKLESSKEMGREGLDMIQLEQATRNVIRKREEMLMTNITYTAGSGVIYSYLNFPDNVDVTLTLAWDDATKKGVDILDDVLNMMEAARDVHHYGPYVIYIPSKYEKVMSEDYNKDYPGTVGTVRDRLLQANGIEDIKVSDYLPDNTVIMVEMSTSSVRMINGFPPTVIQWKSGDELMNHFKVMTIQVPQMISDAENQCGVVVLS